MVIRKIKDHGKKKISELKKRMRRRIVEGVVAAFAFIIALIWRDAIRNTIDSFVAKLGIPETAFGYEFIIAAILTVVCVIGIMIVSKYEIKE